MIGGGLSRGERAADRTPAEIAASGGTTKPAPAPPPSTQGPAPRTAPAEATRLCVLGPTPTGRTGRPPEQPAGAHVVVIVGLGGYKLLVALSKGRYNVLFLILMGVVALFILMSMSRGGRQREER